MSTELEPGYHELAEGDNVEIRPGVFMPVIRVGDDLMVFSPLSQIDVDAFRSGAQSAGSPYRVRR